MPLIDYILPHRSVSIIGMAKNTGKTVCLNYLLSELKRLGKIVAVTSVGIDGEKTDLVTHTEKPEIELAEKSIFVTTEYHYRQKLLTSNILDILENSTSLGRLVTAQVLIPGKVILSGPSTSSGVRQFVEFSDEYGADISIVDGALSRKSHASPLLTDGLVLAVGTALAPDLNSIVNKTSALHELMELPEYQVAFSDSLMQEEKGIFAVHEDGFVSLDIPSSLLTEKYRDQLFSSGTVFFVSGILTDMMLNFLKQQPEIKDTVVIVKDFTKIFVTPMALRLFQSKGGELYVLKRPKLLAVTVNPVAPSGFKMPSETLKEAMRGVFNVPVYDVVSDTNI